MAASKASAQRRLVIVESPRKARTIAGFLGAGFDVEASVGHIRDLPQPSELPVEMKKGPFGKFAVDIENGFEPFYVVDSDKKKKVAELKRLLKDADELYLATDEDREGEAIAWHLLEVLQPKIPVHRMVFHEITREAIDRALTATRSVDERLVDAQETRRILDRLYGYEVSPVLWRKVRAGLSAGRVQSVATRLVVERERERMAFRPVSYWDLTGRFVPAGTDASAPEVRARLVGLDGRKVAAGRDFDDRGSLVEGTSGRPVHLHEGSATALAQALQDVPVVVSSVEEKPYTRRPAAPFTTSTLQQEAGRKLRFSARQTMRVAQSLYEEGYITYMRTDSTNLSDEAVRAARRQIEDLYGAEYVPQSPRVYTGKAKNAQEAHEAIRPAGDSFRTPSQVSGHLRGDEFKLYELIWKRTVASQMNDAKGSTASVRLAAQVPPAAVAGTDAADVRRAEFAASGTVITFRGFLAAYEEGRDEERHSESDAQHRLPPLTVGQQLDTREIGADGHQTVPPPRFTEASLVKALEDRGIGRPSTYAATISTILDRGYIVAKGTALVPTWLAFSVIRLLEDHFGRLVDYDFTASMEADLDRIAAGQADRSQWLSDFYYGRDEAGTAGLKPLVDHLGDIDARDINSVKIGDGIVLRVGRYGPYLETAGEGDDPRRASVPDDVAPDELTVEKARELLETQADGDRELGVDPGSGRTVVARSGRFGPYVTEVLPEDAPKSAKPRTASLFKSMHLQTVTLDDALRLLSLPRTVGVDPESGEPITAQNGRYGPYLKRGTDSRSLTGEDQIFDITLDQALQIYAQPKARGRAAVTPLREIGPDPVTQALITVRDGRFGPYVTDGTTNSTLRKGDEPDTVTLERAAELLAEKRGRTPVKKTAAKKTTAKKTTAKKTTAKKTTATKTAAKKTAAPATGGEDSAAAPVTKAATTRAAVKKTSAATATTAAAPKAPAKRAATPRSTTARSASARTSTAPDGAAGTAHASAGATPGA